MGQACASKQKNPDDEIGPRSGPKTKSLHPGNKSGMAGEGEQPMYNDKFETRDWDRQYEKYIRKLGPQPGPHPDPDCIWNTDPN